MKEIKKTNTNFNKSDTPDMVSSGNALL